MFEERLSSERGSIARGQHILICRDCFARRLRLVPGLFPGLGGIAWQLLLAHPASGLPSLLTLGGSDLMRVISN